MSVRASGIALSFWPEAVKPVEELLQRLMRYVEEMDLEEIIDARWELLQREKADYIPLEEA